MQATRKYSRSSGVLLPLTTLHGPFGIGVMGEEARQFIDFLSKGGFRAWQILPIESTGGCFSPYKCVSAFAGEPMLIDPRMLLEVGLITQEELDERAHGMFENHVEYTLIREKQQTLLRKAYSRVPEDTYSDFSPPWLEHYALYMAIKHNNGDAPWYQWEDKGLRSFDAFAIKVAKVQLRKEIGFYKFVQWLFAKQWEQLKTYAAANNISIIGDLPIYISEDSAEVWSRRDLFDADENGNFKAVGGCPADYYNPDGQLWGNPIYNWKLMKAERYEWWIDRMRMAIERYDIVRLDHFRGFERYWQIPVGVESARDGKWVKGPGIALFKAMSNALGTLPVIAEDLGLIDEKVESLLIRTEYRGMKVIQFACPGDDTHLPHNYTQDTVAFTGTHDNTTLLAWHQELDDDARKWALDYVGFNGDWTLGGPNCKINRAWIRSLYMSGASLVIIPIQDLLGYGADTRTNIPGTADGNWRFRIRPNALNQIDANYYAELCRLSFRENSPGHKNL
ncbi:MAG: 4-alpha-glucanotransferase [Oscillospiraceae bacterium]|nr:4-alpha-glucanotransferase [Oscillospiraceae bacterium]